MKKFYALLPILFVFVANNLLAQEEKMPFGTESSYSVNLNTKTQRNVKFTNKSELPFYESFEAYSDEISSAKWQIKRSTTFENADLLAATSPRWFLCKPSSFYNNGSTYIQSGIRAAAISYTAQNFTWLISNDTLNIESEDISLDFWLYFYNNSSQGISTNFRVAAKIVDTETWQTLEEWNSESPNNMYQQKISLSLAEFNGQQIEFAFVYENYNNENAGFQVAIDEISIGNLTTPDLKVTATHLPYSNIPGFIANDYKFNLGAQVQNIGTTLTETVTLSATIPANGYSSSLEITDDFTAGQTRYFNLNNQVEFENNGNYEITLNVNTPSDINTTNNSDSFFVEIRDSIFATDYSFNYGILGSVSLGNGKVIGNLFQVKSDVITTGFDIHWPFFTATSAYPLPFKLQLYELNPVDSSLWIIYEKDALKLDWHSDNNIFFNFDTTYLAPGTIYFAAVKQLSSTPIGVGYDGVKTGSFWTLDTNGDLQRMANASIGNLAIKLIVFEPHPENYAQIRVMSNGQPVEGATFTVLRNESAVTNAEGYANILLPNGTYDFSVSKEGFATYSGSMKLEYVSIFNEINLSSSLNVEFTALTNGTPIEGVEILVSNLSALTNAEGKATLALTEGTHSVTAMRTGFLPVTQNITVNSESLSHTINMVASTTTYAVTFSVKNENTNAISGASVTIDGYGSKLTNVSGEAIFNGVAPAEINYSISKSGYNTKIASVTVTDANVNVNEILEVFRYEALFEVYYGSVPVSNAKVELDGYNDVFTNFNGFATVENVAPAGSIEFTVSKSGYPTRTGTITVTDDNIRKFVDLSIATSNPTNTIDGIKLFPNPSNGQFTVEVEGKFSLSVFDITGRLVYSNLNAENSAQFDLSANSAGIYIVKIVSAHSRKIVKAIKQ